MTAKIKLYAIAALLPLLIIAVWQWRSEIRNAAQWAVGFDHLERAILEQEQRFERQRALRAREDQLRLELREELQRIRAQQERMARDFRELEKTDAEVANWADVHLPRALVPERLRHPGADRSDAVRDQISNATQ